MSETGPSVKSGIARVAGAVGLAALGFGLNPAETAHADDPPKTSTPAPEVSPTPDTITNRQAILEAIDKRAKELEDKKALDAKIAAAQKRLDALTTPTATSTPPPTATPSPTPNVEATAQAKAFIDKRVKDFQDAEAAAKAQATPPPPTATPGPGEQGGRDPTPQPTSTPEDTGSAAGRGGAVGFVKENWAKILIGAGVVGLGVAAAKEGIPAALRAVRRRRGHRRRH